MPNTLWAAFKRWRRPSNLKWMSDEDYAEFAARPSYQPKPWEIALRKKREQEREERQAEHYRKSDSKSPLTVLGIILIPVLWLGAGFGALVLIIKVILVAIDIAKRM